MQGTVRWFSDDKGFGFIAPEAGGADLFVHRSALGGELIQEGDRVTFTVAEGRKGPQAEGVVIR